MTSCPARSKANLHPGQIVLNAQWKQCTPAQKRADDTALASARAAEEQVSMNEHQEKIRQVAALEDSLRAKDTQYSGCRVPHSQPRHSFITGPALIFSVATNTNSRVRAPRLPVQQQPTASKHQVHHHDNEEEAILPTSSQ